MRVLFDQIPLDQVSTSMTINAPAAVLLLMYQLVAEENGVGGDQITGTIQNDVLKEYIARGTYIYPPAHSLRLITNIFEYCRTEIPKWNTISISGYHMWASRAAVSRCRYRSGSTAPSAVCGGTQFAPRTASGTPLSTKAKAPSVRSSSMVRTPTLRRSLSTTCPSTTRSTSRS